MLKKIKKIFKSGFFSVVGASTINKIIALCNSIFIVRILSVEDFGIYSHVMNSVSIILMCNGLGTITGVLQYGCEFKDDEENRNSIIKYGLKIGLLFNFILSIFIILYGFISKGKYENIQLFFVYASLIPVFSYLIDFLSYILRVGEKNNEYSKYSVISSALVLSMILLGAYLLSITGAILFRYIAYFILIIYGISRFTFNKRILFSKTKKIDKSLKKSFMKFSLLSCANNSIATLFYSMDLFMIGLIIFDTDIIAAYKVATTIPLALTFITSSIMVFVYPYFVKNRKDSNWLKNNYLKLFLLLVFLNGIITVVCYFLAPFIIKIVFGQAYVDLSTGIFRILIIAFFISSTLRIPAGNILDMLHLVKYNFIISIVCGVVNIALDYILILFHGVMGAAIATMVVYILYGLLSNIVILIYLRTNKLISD